MTPDLEVLATRVGWDEAEYSDQGDYLLWWWVNDAAVRDNAQLSKIKIRETDDYLPNPDFEFHGGDIHIQLAAVTFSTTCSEERIKEVIGTVMDLLEVTKRG